MESIAPRQHKARRYLRRKLAAPPVVEGIFAGPPELDLESRASLLALLRFDIESCGLRLAEIRGGWGYRVLATDADAHTRLESDELKADDHDHWWIHDAVWRSSDDRTVLVYGSDPDGNDVSFSGWGPEIGQCLEALSRRLLAHHP